jgi:hypothetical protein
VPVAAGAVGAFRVVVTRLAARAVHAAGALTTVLVLGARAWDALPVLAALTLRAVPVPLAPTRSALSATITTLILSTFRLTPTDSLSVFFKFYALFAILSITNVNTLSRAITFFAGLAFCQALKRTTNRTILIVCGRAKQTIIWRTNFIVTSTIFYFYWVRLHIYFLLRSQLKYFIAIKYRLLLHLFLHHMSR